MTTTLSIRDQLVARIAEAERLHEDPTRFVESLAALDRAKAASVVEPTPSRKRRSRRVRLETTLLVDALVEYRDSGRYLRDQITRPSQCGRCQETITADELMGGELAEIVPHAGGEPILVHTSCMLVDDVIA